MIQILMSVFRGKNNLVRIIGLNLFFLLFAQSSFSQTSDEKKVMIDGEKAFSENNFTLAKDIYSQAVKLDEKNRNFWYNLAASELALGERENACEHFYQAYLLNDGEALNAIKENCPNFRNGSIMAVNDVDEKPKFIYKDKEYLLCEKGALSSKYVDYMAKELRNSKVLGKKAIGRKVYVLIGISKADSLNIEVLKVTGNQEDVSAVKDEVIAVFKNAASYISAKNKGVNVDLWEKWAIPLSF